MSISGTNADVTAHQPLVDNLIICFERAFRKFLPLQRELDNLAVIDRSCNRLIKEENLQIFKGLLDRLLHQLGTKIALDHRVQYHIEIYQSSSANGADDEKGHNKQFSSIEVTVPKKEEGYKLLNRVVIALNHAKIRHGILKDGPESKELVLRISELEVDKVAREEVDKSANKPVGFMRLLTVFNNAVREPLSEQDSTPEDLQAYIRGEPSSQSNGRGPSFVG